jgi:putative transposase
MSSIKILVHCVWTTKNRIPFLRDQIRETVISHIRENAKKKGVFIDHINGYYQHLHALISMGGKQNISEIMQKIKGESSFWINKNNLTRLKFQWQDDFYAVSIGMDHQENLREYIRNQVQHHRIASFEDEINNLIEEYHLERILD